MKNSEKLATIGQAATAIVKAMRANEVKTFEELELLLKALVKIKFQESKK